MSQPDALVSSMLVPATGKPRSHPAISEAIDDLQHAITLLRDARFCTTEAGLVTALAFAKVSAECAILSIDQAEGWCANGSSTVTQTPTDGGCCYVLRRLGAEHYLWQNTRKA